MEYEYSIRPYKRDYDGRWRFRVTIKRDGRSLRDKDAVTKFGAKRLVRKLARQQHRLEKKQNVAIDGKVAV